MAKNALAPSNAQSLAVETTGVRLTNGELPPERTATQSLPEFIRHCAARNPQPLRTIRVVLEQWEKVYAKYEEEVASHKAYPLRQGKPLEETAQVGIRATTDGIEVGVSLEIVTTTVGEVKRPDDQVRVVLESQTLIPHE